MRPTVLTVAALLALLLMLTGCNLTEGGPITPSPTPELIQIEFLTPTEGDRVVAGFDLTIDVAAQETSTGPGIAEIEVYLNGELLQSASPEDRAGVPVFRLETNWLAEGTGFQVLSAIAYRADGTTSDERIITIEVVQRGEMTPEVTPDLTATTTP